MFSNGKEVPVTFNKQLKILHRHMSALLLASASPNIQCSAAYSLLHLVFKDPTSPFRFDHWCRSFKISSAF